MMIEKIQQQIRLQDGDVGGGGGGGGGSPTRGGRLPRRRLGSGGGRIVVDPRQISSTTTISNADILKGNRNTGTVSDNEDGLSGGGRLDIIDLSGLLLDALPNPSINLGAICKLDLSNNHLETIPESLTARLLNVVVLDVHSNQLTSLPNSIGCLSKLKVLNVSGNLLNSLPRSIEDCRSLEELNANFNKLTSLPDTIGFELVNLKKLSVNSNKLILLPYSTSHLTSLRVLDVRLNCLRSLPDDLENLINLEILNVSQNFQYLTSLPYSTGLLLSLIELDASYNNLSALPDSLGCLRKLQKLSVEGNPLVSPSMDVVELGLHAVRQYLAERINGGHQNSAKKKSWFGKLKKHATINGRIGRVGSPSAGTKTAGLRVDHSSGGGSMFEAVASPRYLGMFSPKRLFSSPQKNNYFSRLG